MRKGEGLKESTSMETIPVLLRACACSPSFERLAFAFRRIYVSFSKKDQSFGRRQIGSMARQQLGALASQPEATATIRNQLPERRGKCLPNGPSVLRGLGSQLHSKQLALKKLGSGHCHQMAPVVFKCFLYFHTPRGLFG